MIGTILIAITATLIVINSIGWLRIIISELKNWNQEKTCEDHYRRDQ